MSSDRVNLSQYVAFIIMALIALLLELYPVNPKYSALNPQWLCLIIIYWALYSPFKFGVIGAWSVGLFADVVYSAVWGAHAASLALVAYVCLISYQRIRYHPLWQQTLWVAMFVAIYQIVVNWFYGLLGYSQLTRDYIISIVISALVWPLLYLLLTKLRRHYRFH